MRCSSIGILMLLVFSIGCSGGPEMGDESAWESHSVGLLSVTYGHDWSKDGAELLFTASAQFVRYTAIDQVQVARLLGLPLDPEKDLPPEDTCRIYDLTVDPNIEGTIEDTERGNVELLEAGDLQVETLNGVISLFPRHFPGLLPFVSGVVYGEALSTEVKKISGVKIFSQGGEEVGAFNVEQAESFVIPRLIQVGGRNLNREVIEMEKDKKMSLVWNASGSQDSVTYIEMELSEETSDFVLRCTLLDDGEFDIPPSILTEMIPNVPNEFVLDINRINRKFFSATGLDQGELRVVVRDRVTVLFQ